MTAPTDPHQAAHPIQVAARRTGLSTYVLRAWEQRYGVVSPLRSASGRRLYSDADIERLRLLQSAIRAGRRIGDVASLAREDLVAMRAADTRDTVPGISDTLQSKDRWQASEFMRACIDAIRQMSPAGLESTLYNASVAVSVPVLLEEILSPLLRDIGIQCREGDMRIAEVLMASAAIRSFLGTLTLNRDVPPAAPRVVIATPTGHRHEFGALMAAVTAASEGWNVIYLGSDTPADEIAATAANIRAKAVAISLIYPTHDGHLSHELLRLRRQIGRKMPLLAGGAAVRDCQALLDVIDAVRLDNLTALSDALASLGRVGEAARR